MKMTKEDISGMIGSALFGIVLLLILLFTYLNVNTPPQELEGIPVMFGNMPDAGGDIEPPMDDPTPVPSPAEPIPTPPQVEQPLIAQTTAPTIAVKEQREADQRRREELRRQQRLQQQRQQETERQRRQQEEAARKREAEEAAKRRIDQNVSGLFGEQSGSRGQTQGTGTQGVSTGNSATGAPKGTGGIGTYNLGGRSVGRGGVVQPQYSVNDYGTIVVNIIVDPTGNVINAEIGRGTNTPNTALRNNALKAARSTKFNAISSANNQQGTITYRFNLN